MVGSDSNARELSFKGNKLIQKPIRELEAYWKKEIVHKAVKLEKQTGEKMLDGIHGRIFDMTVECTGSDYRSFEIILAADSENRTSLIYDEEPLPQTEPIQGWFMI